MLTRRLQRFLKVTERATLVRFYFARNNARSNLESRNLCFSSRSLISIYKGQEWNDGSEKRDKTRSCHTETSDVTSEPKLSENNYAHGMLVKSKLDLKTLTISLEPTVRLSEDEVERIVTKDWKGSSADEVLQAFEKLSCDAKLHGCIIEERKHGEILRALTKRLGHLDDEKLSRVFHYLHLWENIIGTKALAYGNLWLELDNECTKRLPGWSTEEMLCMCDNWYKIGLLRKTKFSSKVLNKLGKNPKRLDHANFLHFMFLINTCRKSPINMYEVEYWFAKLVDKFTINELGIVAMGFFKSSTPIRDQNLITKMHLKMMENLEAVEDISISAIMKITRYSTGLKDLDIFQDLLHRLTQRIPQLSIPCLTNIIHAAAFVQCFDQELMKLVIEKFDKEIDNARIKDLERLCWVLSVFDYDNTTPIYQKIVDSLRDPKRSLEMTKFATTVPVALCHLSNSNIFPIDLIKQHFDPDFLHRVYNNNAYKISWDYFTLENNLRIDMPEYDGPFLKPNILNFLSKKFAWSKFNSNDNVRPADQFALEVAHFCKLVLESETSIFLDQVLPHYVKPDIIVCLDEANNPIDPQPILSNITAGTIKYPPPETNNLKWIAVVLATQNQIITGTNKFVGPLRCKVRQLEKIGYIPIVVSFNEWRGQPSLQAKEYYMKKKFHPITDRSASAAVS